MASSELAMLELHGFVRQERGMLYRLCDGQLKELTRAVLGHGVVSTESALAAIRAGNMPFDELVSPERRMVRPRVELPKPADYSEAGIHAATIAARAAETEPPDFERFPVGVLGYDWFTDPEIVELRAYALDDPRVEFSEGRPYNVTSQKYAGWIADGSMPPPARAVETASGIVRVSEGHHRAAALEMAGVATVQIWVGLTRNKPLDNGNTFPVGIAHSTARRWLRELQPHGSTLPF